MTDSKACRTCLQVKAPVLFKKEKRASSGLASICLSCHSHQVNEYTKNNKDKIKALRKKSYDKDPKTRIARSQKWANENPTKRKLIEATYRATHRKENQARSEAWRLKNLDKPREYKLRRRVRIQSNGQFLILPKEIKRLYASACFYCQGQQRIEADHLIPVSKGGRHSIGNLVPACRWCNASKGNRLLSEWKRDR
jgi:5-methylcytosine-specific restriction endonuclease McrA